MLLVCRILVVIVLAALPALAQPSASTGDTSARAQEILKLARAAIGDESKLASIKTLSFSGPSRRVFNDFEQQSEVEVEMLMPDKIRRSTSAAPFPGAEILIVDVINAGKVWFDTSSSMPPGGGGRGGGGGMQRMVMGPGGGGPNDEAARQALIRIEFTRLLLGLFASGPNGVQLEYWVIGEAKAPDGVADVIEVKGPDDNKTRLYVDRNTHRILMLSYRGKDFTSMTRMRGGPGGPGGPGGGPGGQGQRGQINPGQTPGQTPGQGQNPQPGTPQPEMTPEEREQRRLAAQKQREQAMVNLPDVDFFWRFGDYKSEGGLNLPRLITKSTGDKVNEEWQITKVKVNPNIKPDRFEKKEK